MKIFDILKTDDKSKSFGAQVVTTNDFALNHDKILQIFFFCVKGQAKNDFPKDVEKTVELYSNRNDLMSLCRTLCHFVLVFLSPFSIAITSLGEERANLSAFRTFVRFALVWIRRSPLSLGSGKGCGL